MNISDANSIQGIFVLESFARWRYSVASYSLLLPDGSSNDYNYHSADRLQGRRDDLQGSTWNCAAIPGTAVTCRRPTWSADTALCQYQSSSGATSQTVNCW